MHPEDRDDALAACAALEAALGDGDAAAVRAAAAELRNHPASRGQANAQNKTQGYEPCGASESLAQNVTMGYCLCMDGPATKPDWDLLFETASAQEGYFTTGQAAEAGYSTQLLLKHIRAGRVVRTRRGIYRLVHFPAGEHEELITAWLWSERAGVISHQTALALQGLSDALPANVHLTLPQAWRRRRFRVPTGIVLHHADVPPDDRAWFGAAPTTNSRRTLNDCAHEAMAPDLLRQAAQQAIRRGLVTKAELGDVDEALRPFGGLGV